MMREANQIIDFGPGAGEHGGFIIAQGTPQQIAKHPKSITGKYLSGKKKIRIQNEITAHTQEGWQNDNGGPNNEQPTQNSLTIKGAAEHNLKKINF